MLFYPAKILVVFLSHFDKICYAQPACIHSFQNTEEDTGGNVMKSKSATAAYILIGLGIIFLLSNLGWLPPLQSLMAQWWPLILIIVGVLVLIRRSSGKKP